MKNYFLIAVFSYFIGSIPFSFLTAKYIGNIDITKHGSGNSGATNVLRTLGAKAGIIAFLLDFFKGFILATLGKTFFGIEGGVLASIFVVIGHCYSFWLGFKGGKGVATSGGTIFALDPFIGFLLVIIHFSITFFTRIVSLASLSVSIAFPLLSLFFKKPSFFILYALFLGGFVLYKHKENIKRLWTGKESKIHFKK